MRSLSKVIKIYNGTTANLALACRVSLFLVAQWIWSGRKPSSMLKTSISYEVIWKRLQQDSPSIWQNRVSQFFRDFELLPFSGSLRPAMR